jgi:hypothetical protein
VDCGRHEDVGTGPKCVEEKLIASIHMYLCTVLIFIVCGTKIFSVSFCFCCKMYAVENTTYAV